MTIIIDHKFVESPCRKIGMMLPLGEWKNQKLLDAAPGDEIVDRDGQTARILGVAEISATSLIADCLAMQLYGCTMDVVKKRMEERWDIEDGRILYVVIELRHDL